MLGLTIYRQALRLYPARHRDRFGEEMMTVYGELEADTSQCGFVAQSLLCLRETAGVLAGAVREHWRVLSSEEICRLFRSRRFTMQPEFRFPKTTAVLMTVILAGVVMAIQKGEAIEASVPNVNPPIGPIQPVHSTLLPGVFLGLALFYSVGLIGWAILFAMRRSGIHRLDETSAERQ